MIASTSSMPTLLSSGNDGGFGGGGAAWIAILALAFCGGGWGSRNGGSDAEINGRFNSIENQLDGINEMAQMRDNYKESCATNMNVTEQAYGLATQIAQNRFDDAIGFKDVELQLAQCCCNQAANIQQAKQEILDKMSCNEIKALEKEVAALQRQIPAPSYITYPSNLPIIPPVSAANYGYGGWGAGCGGF